MTDFILINGFVFGLVLAAPPGPVGILCVQRTLSEGRMHGLLSGLGAAVGDAIYGAVAAFGISAIQLWIADHQATLRMIGGFVLLILAAKTVFVRARRAAQTEVGVIHTESLLQDFISTFFLTMTNPITMLTFAGLFVILGVTEAGDSVDNAALLVTGVFLGSALWWFALASTANLARPYLNGGYQTLIARISAAILAGFGVYALVTAQFY